MSLSTRLIMNY